LISWSTAPRSPSPSVLLPSGTAVSEARVLQAANEFLEDAEPREDPVLVQATVLFLEQ
jgi:hypothetical protein